MKGRLAVLGRMGGRSAAALVEDGRLADFLIAPADPDMPLPEAIYRAIVDRPVKGQGGVFVRLPGGSAFLKKAGGLAPGRPLLAQVTGHAGDGKATPVSSRILFKGRYAIVTPAAPGLNISRSIRNDDERRRLMLIAGKQMQESDHGLIIRSAAANAPEGDIADDIDAMRASADRIMGDHAGDAPELLWQGPDAHHLAWREWAAPDQVANDPDALENHGVADLLEPFLKPAVALPGQAHIFIEPTRALIAVDVNTGGDHSPSAGLKANLAAACELPRQLRIRGLGGQIVIDFAPMPGKDRRQLEQTLRAAFRSDPIETALVGWTPLGHFELQRKRERPLLATSMPR